MLTGESTGIDGQRLYLGYSVASKTDWIVYAGEPIEKVIGPVSERLLTNLGLGLAVLVVVMLLAGRIA